MNANVCDILSTISVLTLLSFYGSFLLRKENGGIANIMMPLHNEL